MHVPLDPDTPPGPHTPPDPHIPPDPRTPPNPRTPPDPQSPPAAQPFALTGPLPAGVTVLEASAGTGKTFTIAALATRFIAEGAATLDQLLLVTFTRAATSELRERVRERLVLTEEQLGRVAAGAAPTHADEVIELLADAPAETVHQRRARLADAVANFDAVTIETTHGFCQRVLDGLGTLAETDPAVRFVDSVDDLAREVLDDLYVRRFFRGQDEPAMSRAEAEEVARIAIGNPLAPVHPPTPRPDSPEAMRRRLALAVRAELDTRKRALSLMTHDDQLTRLLSTLSGARGDDAVASVRRRFRVVLIDEFQDTDPVQWEILERAFGGQDTTLVLIGDPKQAIYAFRGADVYAYLAAARRAGTRATLHVNWRSDQPLLDGLDALFGDARLGHPGIVYRRVRSAQANVLTRLRGAPEGSALRIRALDSTEASVKRTANGFPNAGSARDFIAADLAADVARLLSSRAELEERDASGVAISRRELAPGSIAVLVRTHRNAALIQRQLEAAGVPAVIGSTGSVFGTPAAAEWLTLLLALEQPSHPSRARAAALTSLVGWSATQLGLAGEPALERLHQRLHGFSRTLREHGVATLTRAVLGGEASARMLALIGGERRLTDLEHVAQLLAAAADSERLGVAALTGWLRQRMAAAEREGANDERTRRLDSDADAVQVLTFHRSKGLEFPIVYCPFLWEPGPLAKEGQPIYFHDDDGRRAIDVALTGEAYAAHLHRHNVEQRGEELRLAYVALTRARHQAVIWWASTWFARDSPLGRLLFSTDTDGTVAWQGARRPRDDEALARLERIAALAPQAVAVESARHPSAYWSPPPDPPRQLERARFTRRIDGGWRRTSYSALTAPAHEALVASEPEATGLTDEPDATSTAAPPQATASELPLAAMASGPRLGTLIHETLQQLDFAETDLRGALRRSLAQSTAHRPALLGCTPEHAADGLALALATPLGGRRGSLSLAGVCRSDRLDELEFELPLAGGDEPTATAARLSDIAALLESELPAGDPARPYAQRLRDPTLATELRGYLTGSIDLVVRGEPEAGRRRHLVIDYKTNWLAAPGEPLTAAHYGAAELALEMQRSHYLLQALLYCAALHRYLRWRLRDYDPARDLGGVRYLFLRGMLGRSSPGSGVFAWDPPAALIVALSDLLAGGEPR